MDAEVASSLCLPQSFYMSIFSILLSTVLFKSQIRIFGKLWFYQSWRFDSWIVKNCSFSLLKIGRKENLNNFQFFMEWNFLCNSLQTLSWHSFTSVKCCHNSCRHRTVNIGVSSIQKHIINSNFPKSILLVIVINCV